MERKYFPAGSDEPVRHPSFDRWLAFRRAPVRVRVVAALVIFREELEAGLLTQADIAQLIGTSPAYLSKIKNSPWARRQLALLGLPTAPANQPELRRTRSVNRD